MKEKPRLFENPSFLIPHFSSGKYLEQFRQQLKPKLTRLWASALARTEDDLLVVEDSSKCPYDENYSVFLVEDDRTSEIAAILIYRPFVYQETKGLNIHICLVHENYQGNGIMGDLIEKAIALHEPQFLYLHTQNEHMIQTVRKFCHKGQLFPIDGQPPLFIQEFADEIESGKINYDQKKMIRRAMFPGGNPLFGDRKERVGTHPDIHQFFEENINFQAGDGLLVVGILN